MPVIKIDIPKFNKRQMTRKQTAINGKNEKKEEKSKNKIRNTQRQENNGTKRKQGEKTVQQAKKRNAPTSPANQSLDMMQFWTLRGISSRGGVFACNGSNSAKSNGKAQWGRGILNS